MKIFILGMCLTLNVFAGFSGGRRSFGGGGRSFSFFSSGRSSFSSFSRPSTVTIKPTSIFRPATTGFPSAPRAYVAPKSIVIAKPVSLTAPIVRNSTTVINTSHVMAPHSAPIIPGPTNSSLLNYMVWSAVFRNNNGGYTKTNECKCNEKGQLINCHRLDISCVKTNVK